MDENTNDILITANFIKEINASIYEYFNDVKYKYFIQYHINKQIYFIFTYCKNIKKE